MSKQQTRHSVDYYIAVDALANATSIEVDNDGDALVTGTPINIDRSKSLLTTNHGSDIALPAYIGIQVNQIMI